MPWRSSNGRFPTFNAPFNLATPPLRAQEMDALTPAFLPLQNSPATASTHRPPGPIKEGDPRRFSLHLPLLFPPPSELERYHH
jgi:hypothetical protein